LRSRCRKQAAALWLQPRTIALAASLACAAVAPPVLAQIRPATAATASTELQTRELRVNLNGQDAGAWTLVERFGILYASQATLANWGVRPRSSAETITAQGQNWTALAAVSGLQAQIDFTQRTLRLSVPATSLLARPAASATPGVAPSVATSNATNSIALHADLMRANPLKASENPNNSATGTPTVGTPAPAPASAASLPATSSTGALRLIPLDVKINSAPVGTWTLLESGGALYATQEAFEEWRLNLRPNAQPLVHRNQTWYPLAAVPGFESQINLADQSIELKFSPAAFNATRLASDAPSKIELTPSIPAAFVNLDVNYNRSDTRGAPTLQDLGVLTELGLSGQLGVLTSSYVGRNLTSDPFTPAANWRRLETTFSRDLPDRRITLRLGDSSTRSGVGARGVYFGGVQITRNFALAPGFITQPLPVISGTASAPSTVELYVNDALRQTSKVPTGPFAIDNFPLLSGSGQARVVVRDVLGRETVLVQPFFSSSQMLEEGLSDWSFELGRVRLDLGIENANYGQRFASGVWRYGLSKQTTLETAGQLGADTQTIGLGITQALPWGTLGYLNLIGSRDDTAGTGREWNLGLENTQLRHGLSLRAVGASREFRQLALQSNTLPNKLETSLNYSYSTPDLGSLGLGLARINTYERGALNTVSANYSMRIGEQSSLTLTATRVSGSGAPAGNNVSVGMSLSIPLDRRTNVSANVNSRGGQTDAYASVSQGLSSETGVGWRALTGTRAKRGYAEGGVYYQGRQVFLTGDVSASSAQQNLRLGLQNALIWTDGELFAARRVQDSYAVVDVAGYKDIGIGFQGADRAKTDAQGRAFISGLLPYQSNSVRLNASDLPISAEIDNLELLAVPAARSAVKLAFPVRTGRAALIKIVQPDGSDAPAGAEVELVGDKKEFFVARRGEAFITGLKDNNQLRVKLADGSVCAVNVTLPPAAGDEIVRLGPLRCEGVK
jgi:outer membrane usher protein